jgi:transcriptional regulator with XRE-family HTH domain
MSPNETLAARRRSLGLTEVEMAQVVGISVSAYEDAEAYPRELREQFSVGQARRLCTTLNIDPCELYQLPVSQEPLGMARRGTLVARARQRLGLSAGDLADKIGFEGWVIDAIERDDSFLDEKVSVDTAIALANILGIEPSLMFREP